MKCAEDQNDDFNLRVINICLAMPLSASDTSSLDDMKEVGKILRSTVTSLSTALICKKCVAGSVSLLVTTTLLCSMPTERLCNKSSGLVKTFFTGIEALRGHRVLKRSKDG